MTRRSTAPAHLRPVQVDKQKFNVVEGRDLQLHVTPTKGEEHDVRLTWTYKTILAIWPYRKQQGTF